MSAAEAAFLTASGWGGAQAQPLAGDASARSYARLTRPDWARAILMRTPAPDPRFARIARHLAGQGLSAPAILAESDRFLLLEDLGDGLLARLARDPVQEPLLYAAAVDLLPVMQAAAPEGLTPLTPALLGEMTAPLFDWYAPGPGAADLAAAIAERAARLLPGPLVFAHRDFHAENLLWLPERAGAARIGLLDFQDAVLAHPAYDLASLLRDARRDVSEPLVRAMIARAAEAHGVAEADHAAATALLAVQRNLRILGIFARLAAREGKRGYLSLIPRLRGQIARDLDHPALAPLRAAVPEAAR